MLRHVLDGYVDLVADGQDALLPVTRTVASIEDPVCKQPTRDFKRMLLFVPNSELLLGYSHPLVPVSEYVLVPVSEYVLEPVSEYVSEYAPVPVPKYVLEPVSEYVLVS